MELKHLIALTLLVVAATGGLFVTVYWQRSRDIAFFFLVSAAVVTDRLDVHFFSMEWYRGTTRGIEISLLDVLAFCLLASTWLAPRYRGPRAYWPLGLGLMLLFCFYAAFSVLHSQPHLYGWFELTKIARGILVFLAAAMFVRTRRELQVLALALACAVGLEGILVLREQYFEHAYRVTGTLGHPNSLSMYLCTATPVVAAAIACDFPPWLRRFCLGAVGLAGVAVLLTISRAGLPIFAAVITGVTAWSVSWRLTWRKVVIGVVLVGGLAFFVHRYWDELAQRYQQDSLAEEYLDDSSTTAEGRGVYLRWARAIVHDHFFGVGLNNWSYAVAKTYGPRIGFTFEDYDDLEHIALTREVMPDLYLPAPAHNLAALTIGELGVPGLVIFALLWARWFFAAAGFLRWRRDPDPMRTIGMGIFFAIAGIFMQSVTEWTYRQTAIFFTFNILLGTLASLKRPPLAEPASEEITVRELEAEPTLVLQGQT